MGESTEKFVPEMREEKKFDIITRTSELVAGTEYSEFDYKWVEENIKSIREAVKKGQHDVVYYPASGRDVLRVLVAYDAEELILVDDDEQHIGESEEQLKKIGIQPEVTISSEGNRRELIFDLEGKKRKIVEVNGDARVLTPDKLGVNQIDVLHIYLPTGAAQDIREDEAYLRDKYGNNWIEKRDDFETAQLMENDPDQPKPESESGEYKVVTKGIVNQLDVSNYEMVSEGGFFVFSETRLQRPGEPIQSLYEIAGLEEIPITGRHPHTVLTSFIPRADELEKMNSIGYIYRKNKTVDTKIIEIFNEAAGSGYDYFFTNLREGRFGLIDIGVGDKIDIGSAITNYYNQLEEKISMIVGKMTEARVEQSLIQRYRKKSISRFKNEILTLQGQFKELLREHGKMQEEYSRGEEITEEKIKTRLGIVEETNNSGESFLKNTKWPLAVELVASGDEGNKMVYEIISQFAEAKLDFIQDK